jgi:hypothetical protein
MSADSVQATTYRCDMPNCGVTQIVAGEASNVTIQKTFGWSLGQQFFSVFYDLCKAHTDELREWIDAEGPAISCTCTTKIDLFCEVHGLESKEPTEVEPL